MVGSRQSLQIIDLGNNYLEGEIPAGLANCLNLTEIYLDSNVLHGSIPDGFGMLPKLSVMYVPSNKLTDKIPYSLGSSSSLYYVVLANNSLTGGIPPLLANSSSLEWLDLGSNDLDGEEMADDELTDMMYDMEFGELMKDWIEDWSDDENSDRGDRSENGNVLEDLNENNEHDDGEENNSEISNEDYISQLISECHNAYDYDGESDAETGLDVESLAASDSGESQSSVIMSEVTEVEGKKNVQDIASADDKRDMCMEIIQMTFTSHEAAYDFYNSYARDNGFSIRKNRVRYSKTESCHMRYRRFVCSRQGKRDNRLLTEEGHSRRLRPETRCHCEAHLTVKLDQKRGVWYVDSFEDKHSHILAGPDEVPFLWSHRKIKEYQRAEILSMGAAGIRIHDMMDTFISKHVWYGGVGFTRREIYNLCAREKRKLLSKGDAAIVIGIMVSRKQRDPSFFFEYKLDKEGHMHRMFWCDSQSRHDYEDFGDVLVFDSTYKMNRYGMPFIPFVGLNNHRKTTVFACAIVSDETEETYVWLLETFLRSMCQKMPMSVITDADAAMIKAIRQVLPDVWHRICTWHIEKNMKIHLSHKSLKEFRTLLYYSTSTTTFEERWHAFSKRWQSEKTVTWLRRMYKKRRLWAAAYLTEGFWLGMKSN
ncbi:protein FAR1-RELATED SEQUENCE 5-like isoform X2 [Aegilops tauschii subsp. strangulata]|uniref:protein FAR1-RELATED SEQUENCE 5-like isoform X2 n=1 Tax=Aegilops tauschii subsp. strangulata TaxID=200361 RepID=UPI003CC83E07